MQVMYRPLLIPKVRQGQFSTPCICPHRCAAVFKARSLGPTQGPSALLSSASITLLDALGPKLDLDSEGRFKSTMGEEPHVFPRFSELLASTIERI